MGRKISQPLVPGLRELRRRFAAWRGAGRRGRRIPEELWSAAAGLARELGVNRVARVLSLDYSDLKGRVFPKPKAPATATEPVFVEFAMDGIRRSPESIVEFEGERGKITIRLAGHSPADLVALVEVLTRVEQ